MRLLPSALIPCLVLARALVFASEPPEFGFQGMEIFRASGESECLQALDLDGDQRTDLVYADNEDATIRLLFQVASGQVAPGQVPAGSAPAKPPAAEPQGGRKRSVNEIASDERFRVERFFTEKKVTALRAADFDGDRKPDLAYYGDPKELEVVFQGGEWGSRREKFAITDGMEGYESLAALDLNGDQRTDLVLLGKGKTYIFWQRSEGGLEKPQTIFNSYSDVDAVLGGDLDGDGRPDLVLLRSRATHPFLLRFQREGGFGPEIPVKSLPVHHAILASLEDSGPARLLTVQGNTRRIRALRWGKPKKPPAPALSEPRLYAFRPEGDASARRSHFGDVNGDGRVDLLVSSAETAELDIYLQTERGDLAPPSAFSTLAEVKGIAVADLGGEPGPEVVVVSAREKAIGVSRWLPSGGLSIQRSYPVEGEPLLVAAGRLAGAGAGPAAAAHIICVHNGSDGRFHLTARGLAAGGALSTVLDVPFEAGAEPNGLAPFDADGDSRLDAMVFVPYEDPRLFVQEGPAGGELKMREASAGKDFGIGQISKLSPAAFSLADLDPGPAGSPPAGGEAPAPGARAMLVAYKSFARALVLDREGRLQALAQFPARGAAAEISGAAALDLDQDPEKEVLLFDRAESAIDILDRTPQGQYRPQRSISMPGFEFLGFQVIDLNGDRRDDAAILGKQAVAILYQGGEDGELEEVARHDPEEKIPGVRERPLPDLLAVGDLNADGARDIVFSTDPQSLLGFLSPEAPGSAGLGKLSSRLTFPIFEERAFMRNQPGHGPREIIARDMTGDGKTDLVLLIHDRILLYPQE